MSLDGHWREERLIFFWFISCGNIDLRPTAVIFPIIWSSLNKIEVIMKREAEPRDRETEPDSFVGDPVFPRCMSQYFTYLLICLLEAA